MRSAVSEPCTCPSVDFSFRRTATSGAGKNNKIHFHCFPTRQLTGTGATLANTCSHKAAPNVSAPDANAYGARRPRSTCQKRHKQLITDEMLKHESLNISIYSAPLVFKTKTKPFNNVLMDVISCQIAASTVAFKLKNEQSFDKCFNIS
ncbi:hypothetical protein T4B_9359 [Trichinella pseudospiralis]|uniref:Uncharacterized protein n=2 Tax=Trichinella pseudospiralis TaxID=6337 RepID=A0A0V0YA90_TRIPS|nr:hypothetical protein T4E_498 [Trichinella pseudospiralis]KRY77956.1 hypothetical protein T4A_1598 [Trichinella pseudospiralis]KRY93078.1 hypothetical protein T4D_220 [Trichinella pseudospiralis]KRZ26629.1 hypothetical protein T4B_9359 [Trichinella pseudospiralis]KRZ41442.1 hypothetical protein T4C_7449 [Trichinella pseudospiralis]